jgi:3-hydroxy-3-methylglutaryl CoA synthase
VEIRIKEQCREHNIAFIEGQSNETIDQQNQRMNDLKRKIKNARYNQVKDEFNQRRREAYSADKDARNESRRESYPEFKDAKNERRRKARRKQSNDQRDYVNEGNNTVPNILGDIVDLEKAIKEAIEVTTRTRRENDLHQATVCVICDRVIIGVEKIEQIAKQRLIDNQHRLSVEAFESFFDIELNPILKEQYQLDDNDLHGMLLSPRAYCSSNGKYECCEACYKSLNI